MLLTVISSILKLNACLSFYDILGATPRAVAAVQREEIPGGTTVLPGLRIIGHRRRRRRPEDSPRAQAAEDIAPGRDLRGETTGRDRALRTDLTGESGSDRALPLNRPIALPTPADRDHLFRCRRAGKWPSKSIDVNTSINEN